MTIRLKLIMLAIIATVGLHSLLSLAVVFYSGRVWLDEIQDRVRLDLCSAEATYDQLRERAAVFVRAAALDESLARALETEDQEPIRRILNRLYHTSGMDFVSVLDARGRAVYRPGNPDQRGDDLAAVGLVRQALEQGQPASGTILLSAGQLEAEGPGLVPRARFEVLDTPAARPTEDRVRTGGMVIAAVAPIVDDQQQTVGLLLAGDLLNRRYEIVDHIKDKVFSDVASRLTRQDLGSVTIFQDDLRIATNVYQRDGSRAVGTRMSSPVYEQVIQRGGIWAAPAFVVNEWHITAYGPIREPTGQVIGSLYVGLRQAPFVRQRQGVTALFLSAMLAVTVALIAVLLGITNWVLHPVKRIVAMCRRVIQGDLTARVAIRPAGELGILCEAIDRMGEAVQQREDALHQATRQQIGRSEKLASIGRLAAGIAHEINNPLTGVLTFAHLMRDRSSESSQDREDLDLIIHETQRAAEIVRGLLDFARERPPVKQPLDVNDAVRRIVRLVENQQEMRPIQIDLELDENLPEILGDAHQLQQVLLNLLLNAAAAMPHGGLLTIRTRAEGEQVRLQVSDTGCGIAPEHLDQIFDPFFTTKPVGQGTGLGLSVSFGIIEQHGGSIEVESEVGNGSTFTLRLPVAAAECCGLLEEGRIIPASEVAGPGSDVQNSILVRWAVFPAAEPRSGQN